MKKYFILLSVLFVSHLSFSAPKQKTAKAEKLFNEALEYYNIRQYQKAKCLLDRSIKYDSTYVRSYLLLSDIYDEFSDLEKRRLVLEKVNMIQPKAYPRVYKFLCGIYLDNGEFKDALQCLHVYKGIAPLDSVWTRETILKAENACEIINNEIQVEINRLDSAINTSANEYWPLISSDDSTLYFTRLISDNRSFAYERLMFSELDNEAWLPAKILKLSDDEAVNEGTICISADGNLIFYTACGLSDGKGSCDLYYMQFLNGKWTSPANVGSPVNTAGWEAQPSVSAFNNKLYFASNRADGLGRNDIWMSKIVYNHEGRVEFCEPINLGEGVNTALNDFSPFIHADGETLYFSSEGRNSIGKSDMFLSRLADTVWGEAVNLGYPINSIAADDGLVVSPTAETAIFSSNRSGSNDFSKDLYQFLLPNDLMPCPVGYVKGNVYDSGTGKKLSANIEINDLKYNNLLAIESNIESGFIFTMKSERVYSFNVLKKGYLFYSKNFNYTKAENLDKATRFDIYLEPIRKDAKVVLQNMFFEFDSFVLTDLSKPELDKLVYFMQINSQVTIEISGHTDNQGSEQYNLKLSENRAKAIKYYLAKNIDAKRMNVCGYGSSMPIATNKTEEGQAKNRRVELRIIGN